MLSMCIVLNSLCIRFLHSTVSCKHLSTCLFTVFRIQVIGKSYLSFLVLGMNTTLVPLQAQVLVEGFKFLWWAYERFHNNASSLLSQGRVNSTWVQCLVVPRVTFPAAAISAVWNPPLFRYEFLPVLCYPQLGLEHHRLRSQISRNQTKLTRKL